MAMSKAYANIARGDIEADRWFEGWSDLMGDSPSRICRTWVKRLEGDTLTRGQIMAFKNTVAPLAAGHSIWKRTNLTEREARALRALWHRRIGLADVYRLEPAHDEFGRIWLGENWSRVWNRFNPPDDLFEFSQVATEDTFRFVGLVKVWTNDYANTVGYSPIYATRYFTRNGSEHRFTYHWEPWQS